MIGFRIGHGYDAHRLKMGRPLILGGVTISHDCGLDGHSDADVLVHAIMDALLGAAALGDIGTMFPDSDGAYKNADSIALLAICSRKLGESGWRIGNIDATIVAQAPRLSPYIPQMRGNIAAALELDMTQVSVKATTEEGMGFTGHGEGMAAHGVCLIERL